MGTNTGIPLHRFSQIPVKYIQQKIAGGITDLLLKFRTDLIRSTTGAYCDFLKSNKTMS